MKTLTKKEIKEIIETGYDKLEKLNHKTTKDYIDICYDYELEAEKEHRRYAPNDTKFNASASLCAKYFVLESIVDQLEESTIEVTAILDYRLSYCYIQALVYRYKENIEALLEGFDFEGFKEIDYAEDLI